MTSKTSQLIQDVCFHVNKGSNYTTVVPRKKRIRFAQYMEEHEISEILKKHIYYNILKLGEDEESCQD